MLRAGTATGTAAALGAAGLFAAGTARAATTAGSTSRGLPYPADITDTSHCTPEAAEIFRGFFTAKSEHDAAGVMSYFAKANTMYADACLGAVFTSWQALSGFFTPYLPSRPAAAISYPLRIVGDARSAAVELVDTPAFFGYEIRALSTVTFDSNRKIIRWVDYWDGRSSLHQNTITSSYPADFRDSEQNAAPAVVQAAQALQAAFAAGDAVAAAGLMSADVVHEDMAAHTPRPRPVPGPALLHPGARAAAVRPGRRAGPRRGQPPGRRLRMVGGCGRRPDAPRPHLHRTRPGRPDQPPDRHLRLQPPE
jgi:hypothetical protein